MDIERKPLWLEFFETHRNWLASVIYVRVSDRHAVEEVLQETALAAVANAPVSIQNDAVPKWLYKVAIRQSLLYRRKMGRDKRKHESAALATESSGVQVANPLGELIALEEQDQVRKALGNLAPRDAEILIFKYNENLSCLQISERVGAKENAVKSRLLRARKKLLVEIEKLNSKVEIN